MTGDGPSATAHAPGSVTVIFAPPANPADAANPAGDSRGVSFAIEDGVDATVEPAHETTITLDGEPTTFAPVEIALRELGVTAAVGLDATIPVGYGFGASGAATLSTVLAANEAIDCGKSREELLDVAARAEVEAGTGVGDVFIQDQGGVVSNTGDGPRRVETTEAIEYTALAGIATEDVLGDERALDVIREAGHEGLSRYSPDGSLRNLLSLSWEFARRTGLATERVADEVERVERAGGAGSMAMFGETVVATGVDGVLERRTHVTDRGAHLRDPFEP